MPFKEFGHFGFLEEVLIRSNFKGMNCLVVYLSTVVMSPDCWKALSFLPSGFNIKNFTSISYKQSSDIYLCKIPWFGPQTVTYRNFFRLYCNSSIIKALAVIKWLLSRTLTKTDLLLTGSIIDTNLRCVNEGTLTRRGFTSILAWYYIYDIYIYLNMWSFNIGKSNICLKDKIK